MEQDRFRKVALENLELHVAHGCNLACESCSHYSNHAHAGLLSVDDAGRWMSAWSERIAPRTISLLGGEPSLHPALPEFVVLVRTHWPRTRIRIVSNGFHLHRHPALPRVLRDDPNVQLFISIHHQSPEYLERLKPIRELAAAWTKDFGIPIRYYESHRNWTRRYLGFGSDMAPYEDERPRLSWEACPAKRCMQLFEGRIWKCGPLAYLKLQAAKYRISDKWTPYLRYQPLAADCSDDQLVEFVGREDETYCGMCPAKPQRFELPVPLRVKAAGAG